MDKNAIKKYAVWARRELIARVTQKAEKYEITEQNTTSADADSIGGRVLTSAEKKQRRALIEKIKADGFEQVMEEVAYTWFNRFTALRFMEVNNYLPSHTRVFTNEEGAFKPQILADAISLELEGLDMEKVYELKDTNKTEELYRYLLITQCNALSAILPQMFQKIEDYTELLLPDYLLREGSVIEQMIALIPEEDWTDQVQIIGWLYQYYNSEKKDDVFAALKKNVKITKENIPAATQLFTPDWIVRYMVENSLGRLWLEGHPDVKEQLLPTEEEQSAYAAGNRDPEDSKWHYYLEEAEQEPEVQAQLAEIRKEYAALKPEEIKCIDPCSGSGHILAYLFDVLMKIYESYGYTSREAVGSIVENNLYGLDIDERAAQLAYFAVMMKARQYDRRFFNRKDEDGNISIPQPHVYAIVESGNTDSDGGVHKNYDAYAVEYFCNGDATLKEAMDTIIRELHDAKEYGSILTVTPQNWKKLYARFDEIRKDIHMYRDVTVKELLPLVQVAEALAQKYDVTCTNPPYMGSAGMGTKLGAYIKKNYPDSGADMFSVFIERCCQICKFAGYVSMITMHGWMFIDSYYKLRKKIFSTSTIESLVHHGIKAFEFIGNDVVQTCSFILSNSRVKEYKSEFVNLTEAKNYKLKEEQFFNKKNYSLLSTDLFMNTPTGALCYWVGEQFFKNYEIGSSLEDYVEVSGAKNVTGDNERFLRLFWEVEQEKIDRNYWAPCAKGGAYRKYYGNVVHVIDWRESAKEFYRSNKSSSMTPEYSWFKPGVTYSSVSSRGTGFRYVPKDCQSESSGPILNFSEKYLYYFLGFFNTKIAELYLKAMNPSINLQKKDLKSIPYIVERTEEVSSIVKNQIEISRRDWSSYETSIEFERNALVPHERYGNGNTIIDRLTEYITRVKADYDSFYQNELEINNIFKEIYKFNDFNIEFERRDVSVKNVENVAEIRALISYAVGCMFGRYSLDVDGLAYAGGVWDSSKYQTYLPDKDNIIPICDDDYFDDDITGCFIKWVETVYGADTLEENLRFIASALGDKGSAREVIRNYFISDFYSDHLKTYQKRPIYWLFDSGKKNGFKCLIYMHRYQPDTIARIRTDYVHEQQSRYRTAIAGLESRINEAGTSERVKLKKQMDTLQAQATEIREYEEKIHHLADQMIRIDLDDGVKVNYAKFQDVLAKIK